MLSSLDFQCFPEKYVLTDPDNCLCLCLTEILASGEKHCGLDHGPLKEKLLIQLSDIGEHLKNH